MNCGIIESKSRKLEVFFYLGFDWNLMLLILNDIGGV
jgi:hypothetical protein